MQLYHELCQVFGQASALSLRAIERWIAAIKGGTFTLEKETSLGRPSSTKIPTMIRKVYELITSDPRLSVAVALHNYIQIVRQYTEFFTKDLDIRQVCSVWVPSELSERNKSDRVACCRRILADISLDQSGV